MYQITPKSEEYLSEFETYILISIKTLHHYNSAVKYMYVLPTAFKSLHQFYVSTFILQITTIILR